MRAGMNKELLAEAIIGKDAEEFFASELGQVVIGRADQEYSEALEGLRTVDPEDAKSIRELQNKAWRAESFKGWLAELIISGKQAIQTLDAQE